VIDTEHRLLRVTNQLELPQKLGRWTIQPNQTVEVPLSFLEEFGSVKGISIDFSGVQEMLRTHDEEGHLAFDFRCPLSMIDGYGRHALAIWQGLQQIGAAPVLREVDWHDKLSLPPETLAEARANASRLPCRIGVCMSVPYDWHHHEGGSTYSISITQFETDRVPEYHVQAMNRVDHLIVTSHFQPDVWRRSGLRKGLPISVLTPGVDTDYYAFRERRRDGAFKVLIVGALTARKDPITAVKAFQEASNGDDSWRLTIKTRRADGVLRLLDALGVPHPDKQLPDSMRPQAYAWKGAAPVDPRVEVWISDDPPERIRDLYWSHDCFLWPSKGEGCGLPPLEAMSTGMEVVMSDNSGMADYAFDDHCWPVGASHMEPADGPGGFSHTRVVDGKEVPGYVEVYGSVGNWWVPDFKQLVRQLRRAHEAWAKGRGKGARAAQYVRAHHTLAHQAHSVLKVVERYA
jgi:glycosyltransferase involved in cell wall biosynthesis